MLGINLSKNHHLITVLSRPNDPHALSSVEFGSEDGPLLLWMYVNSQGDSDRPKTASKLWLQCVSWMGFSLCARVDEWELFN
jgi:hypothetical protein